MTSSVWKVGVAAVVAMATMGAAGGCGSDPAPSGEHKVFLFGYIYDGATGTRLPKDAITGGMSVQYGAKVLPVDIEADGRFVTKAPLPTWQDYTVSIDADGYRAFYSQNRGFDVPISFTQNDDIATSGSTQTFQFDAYLFPNTLMSPRVNLTVNLPTDPTATTQPKANGTARLRPTSSSSVESIPDSTRFRRWPNDNDLLTQTITKDVVDGQVEIPAGEMVYGVSYQLSVYNVPGFQPMVSQTLLVAGTFTSRSFDLVRELRDPIHAVSVDTSACTLPLPTAAAYGAQVSITFDQEVAFFGTTFREDIDNALLVNVVASSTSAYTCPLNTGIDPALRERGSKVDVAGKVVTFSWNPSTAWAPTYLGSACALPQSVISVSYGSLTTFSNLFVLPAGGDATTERRSLYTMLTERGLALPSCPAR